MVQKTSEQKGGQYAITGGHVQSGQSCEQACLNEIEEELGVVIERDELNFVTKFNHKNAALFYIYQTTKDISLDELKYQSSEVDFASWKTAKEIEQLKEEGKLRETSKIAFEHMIDSGIVY